MGLTQRPFACSSGISTGKARHWARRAAPSAGFPCLPAPALSIRVRVLDPHRDLETRRRWSQHSRSWAASGEAIGPGPARRVPPGTSSTSSSCPRKGRRMAGRSRAVSRLSLGGACCPRAAPFLLRARPCLAPTSSPSPSRRVPPSAASPAGSRSWAEPGRCQHCGGPTLAWRCPRDR
jgi:hypothetical protein